MSLPPGSARGQLLLATTGPRKKVECFQHVRKNCRLSPTGLVNLSDSVEVCETGDRQGCSPLDKAACLAPCPSQHALALAGPGILDLVSTRWKNSLSARFQVSAVSCSRSGLAPLPADRGTALAPPGGRLPTRRGQRSLLAGGLSGADRQSWAVCFRRMASQRRSTLLRRTPAAPNAQRM